MPYVRRILHPSCTFFENHFQFQFLRKGSALLSGSPLDWLPCRLTNQQSVSLATEAAPAPRIIRGAGWKGRVDSSKSAYAMHGDREKILNSKFDGYLSKPVNARALTKELERLFGTRENRDLPPDPPHEGDASGKTRAAGSSKLRSL